MNSRKLPAPSRSRTAVLRPIHQLQPATAPDAGRFAWLSPTMVWPLASRQLPKPAARPQGGGTQRNDEEAVFAAIVYVLVSRVPWRALPKSFPVSWQNTHRRFTQWSEAGMWERLRDAAHAQWVPEQMRQWAVRLAALADERMDRSAPSPLPARRAEGRGGSLKPEIRVHRHGEFTARLFGSSLEEPARPTQLTELRGA